MYKNLMKGRKYVKKFLIEGFHQIFNQFVKDNAQQAEIYKF